MIQKMPLRKTAKVCKAADRRGDGRRPLSPATRERPAAIQHSALSIQHCRRPPILRQMPEHLQK